MGYYDPPDDLPTENVIFDSAGLELDATLQILAFEGDNLEELVKENLVQKFSIDLTDLVDLDVWVDERTVQVLQEYPGNKALYQCEATIYGACLEFDWDCGVSAVWHEIDPNGEIEQQLAPYNPRTRCDEPVEFDGQDIINPNCKFIKVLKLTYAPGSFNKDYYKD